MPTNNTNIPFISDTTIFCIVLRFSGTKYLYNPTNSYIVTIYCIVYFFYINFQFNFPNADGKYHMLPSGELLILNVTRTDIQRSYRCRTHHQLTQEAVISGNVGRIQLTGDCN